MKTLFVHFLQHFQDFRLLQCGGIFFKSRDRCSGSGFFAREIYPTGGRFDALKSCPRSMSGRDGNK